MPKTNAYLRGIAPKATARDLNAMMWSCTPYPFAHGGLRRVRRGLRKYFRLGGNSVEGAIAYAHDQLDYEFETHQHQNNPQRVDTKAPPTPPQARKRNPPSDPATRQYSRALNRALKFHDVVGFKALLSAPPHSLEFGWWVGDLSSQLVGARSSTQHLASVQLVMFEAFLDSNIPLPEGCFRLALESRNYAMMRALHVRGLSPTPDWGLKRDALWQLFEGEWPIPEVWCPDVLQAVQSMPAFDRLFPNSFHPKPKGFCREHLLRLSSLPINDEFTKNLCMFYGKLAGSADFKFLDTEAHRLAVGTLMEMGWINQTDIIANTKPKHLENLRIQMHRAMQVMDHYNLNVATPSTTMTRSLNRL